MICVWDDSSCGWRRQWCMVVVVVSGSGSGLWWCSWMAMMYVRWLW